MPYGAYCQALCIARNCIEYPWTPTFTRQKAALLSHQLDLRKEDASATTARSTFSSA